MQLIINGTSIRRSSLGARRYYSGVMRHLTWPEPMLVTQPGRSRALERLGDLLAPGRKDAIYWSPSHQGPLFARNHVVTVLDCINVQYTYRHDWRLPLLRATFGALLRNAVAVVTISEATRDAVLECFDVNPRKVIPIPGPSDLREDVAAGAKSLSGVAAGTDRVVLMITNSLPHKNGVRAARAMAASSMARRGMVLRLVGSLPPEALGICAHAGIAVDVRTGVDDATLYRWLLRSRFLFSPPLVEGLNLPIGESLALGGRVLCSDIPVHREFYDGAVLFCDPLDEAAMAHAIDDALSCSDVWESLGPIKAPRSFADIAKGYQTVFARIEAGDFR
jgi:glycosyltransferase involved in cell wall biosynthesis